MARFALETETVLRNAGWAPGRQTDISAWVAEWEKVGVSAHDAAQSFLREFGGLSVDISGPGITVARTPFELDPEQCEGEDDRFLDWSEDIGHSLFPIGVLDMGRYFLGIDENSEVYALELWVASYGRMPEAMDNLITGVRPVFIRELRTPRGQLAAARSPHREQTSLAC